MKRILGILGKSRSQPAEANHASIVAHFGPGSTQDMVIQIKDLLSRQTELEIANTSADTKDKLLSDQLAHDTEAQKNISDAAALQTLSNWGYNEYWTKMCQESVHYSLLSDQGDKYDHVHWSGWYTSQLSLPGLFPRVVNALVIIALKLSICAPMSTRELASFLI